MHLHSAYSCMCNVFVSPWDLHKNGLIELKPIVFDLHSYVSDADHWPRATNKISPILILSHALLQQKSSKTRRNRYGSGISANETR